MKPARIFSMWASCNLADSSPFSAQILIVDRSSSLLIFRYISDIRKIFSIAIIFNIIIVRFDGVEEPFLKIMFTKDFGLAQQ
jgi:hypothetical protein